MNEAQGSAGNAVLVCFAVKEEAAPFLREWPDRSQTSILITGMGRNHTERSLQKTLPLLRPKRVFTCGFAGALDPGLKIGDVLFETADSSLRQVLAASGARQSSFHCSPVVAITTSEKRRLREATGRDAVEMESQFIHNLCQEHGISACATVRVVSDAAEDDLPLDFNRLMTADQELSMPKLLAALARNPGAVSGLLRLRRHTAWAAQRLSAVLCESLRRLGSGPG